MEESNTQSSASDQRIIPEAELIDAIKPVIDPEIGLSIVDLGLIYKAEMLADGTVHVLHTLTSPMCPLGPQIMSDIHNAVAKLDGVKDVNVEITFNPPWDPHTMASEDVKMMLGIF